MEPTQPKSLFLAGFLRKWAFGGALDSQRL